MIQIHLKMSECELHKALKQLRVTHLKPFMKFEFSFFKSKLVEFNIFIKSTIEAMIYKAKS